MNRVVAILATAAIAVLGAIVPTSSAQSATDCRSTTKRFAGEFVSPSAGPAGDGIDSSTGTSWSWWNANDWTQEMQLAQQLCVDEVILQWTAQSWSGSAAPAGSPADPAPSCVEVNASGSGTRSLYPSSNAAWETSRLSYATSAGCVRDSASKPLKRHDTVGLALAAAKATGRKVWLGLLLPGGAFFSSGGEDSEWMAAQTQTSKEVASELWALYGTSYAEQIAGFYLPLEGNNVEYSTDPGAGAQYKRYANLLDYTKKVSAHLRSVAGDGVQIMTSPYHVARVEVTASKQTTRQNALEAYRRVVAGIVTGTGVTVYAPQDSLGGDSDPSVAAEWMAAARLGIEDARAAGSKVDLWANIEQYSMRGAGSQPIGQLVAHMGDVNASATIGGRKLSADIDHYIGFSLANFSPRWYLIGQSAGLRAAYAYYLANPGSSLKQAVPRVAGLSATVVASSLDVSVQWSAVSQMPTPESGVAAAPVLGYVVYRNGLQVGHVAQRFASRQGPDGFYGVDASGPATFTDPSVPTGATLTYEVAAFDSYGNLSPRTQVDVVVPLGAADLLASVEPTSAGGGPRVSDNAAYSVVDHDRDPSSIWDAVAPGDAAGAYVDGRPVPKVLDGHVGEGRYEDPAWVGLVSGAASGSSPDAQIIEIELPGETDVHGVRTHWLSDRKVGVSAPDPSKVGVSTRDQASRIAGTPFQPLISSVEIASGINPDGSKAGVAIPDPGTGWYTDALLGAAVAKAESVRVSVASAGEASWAFLSEVQVLSATGTDVCESGACTARVLAADGGEAAVNRYASASGRTLTGPQALRLSDGTLSSKTYPWDVAGQAVGWKRSAPFDVVVDLGNDQPIGRITSDWFNTQGGAKAPAVSAFILADDAGSSAPNVTPTASWVAVDAKRTDSGTITGYTATPTSTASGPVRARWVKLVVSPTDLWAISTNLTVTAPESFDAARCGSGCSAPRVYKTASDTTADPAAVAPLASTGAPVADPCRSSGTACSTDNPAGPATLTRPMPDTDHPDYEYIRANGLTLRSSTSWDIVAPIGTAAGPGVAHVAAPTISLVYSPNIGSALPASIDLYTGSSGEPSADAANPDGSRNWRGTGVRAIAPKLPSYVPADTAFIHTYTFPELKAAAGQKLEAIRFHLNTRDQQAIATRVQAGAWK